MRKKLIAAIIVALLLLAAGVGVIIYMESKPGEATTPESTGAQTEASEASETEASVETTEETVGLSLPTENPDDVTPEDTFGEEEEVPPVTGSETTGETEGPDANESPEDEF